MHWESKLQSVLTGVLEKASVTQMKKQRLQAKDPEPLQILTAKFICIGKCDTCSSVNATSPFLLGCFLVPELQSSLKDRLRGESIHQTPTIRCPHLFFGESIGVPGAAEALGAPQNPVGASLSGGPSGCICTLHLPQHMAGLSQITVSGGCAVGHAWLAAPTGSLSAIFKIGNTNFYQRRSKTLQLEVH